MGAIAVHHTATENSAWDGPAAVAAMPNDASVLRYCHAWQGDGDKDAKGTYKFPHHRKQGGPANLPACRNGLARLDSADIPDGDREGVRKHLQAHLDDADTKDQASPLTARLKIARPLAKLQQGRADWYSIRNLASGGTEVMIYDEIGYFGVTASDFARELASLDTDSITLRINSPGGEVFDGIAIYNTLKQHKAHVTTQVDSVAASIASVIAMAGDEIVMMRNAQMMIHDGFGMVIGPADEMRKTADLLDKASDNIASIYAERAGGDVSDWRDRMRAESWFSADEAVTAGLADRVAGGDSRDEQPANNWDLSIFAHAGRAAAPEPVPAIAPESKPPTNRWEVDPEILRRALKEAAK